MAAALYLLDTKDRHFDLLYPDLLNRVFIDPSA
jgi:hypothetical protein